MPNDNSQATPEEPVIPAEPEVPEFTPSAEGSTPEGEPQKEKPLTLEDIRRIAKEEATRIAQSQVAKGENRIQKQIQERFDALEKTKAALGLSEDQVAQARQRIVTDAYSSPDEQPQTNQPTAAQSDADQAIQYMNAQIGIVFREVGTAVTRTDPEFRALQTVIDQSWNDEDGLARILIAAQKAANSKAQRLQAQTQTAAGRVVGGGPSSGQAAPQIQSAHDAWEHAYKK